VTNALQPQLENAEEIKNILKEVSVTFNLDDGREVKTLMVYLPIENGESCHSEFFKTVKEGLLSNFVFSCSEVEKKLGVENPDSAEKLFNKAIRKLSKKTAQGELGELLLFTLLDVYFEAPKLLSKIADKGNPRMPAFGADAVHGQFLKEKFIIYTGEAKLHEKYKSAASKAAKSMMKAKEKYYTEFDLLDSNMDFPNFNEELKQKLIDLIDPFSDINLSETIHSPCFIGFSEPALISDAKSNDDFIESYKKLAREYIADFFSKTENQGLTIEEVSLLMLPFTCIDRLVNEFIEYMGIEE